MGRAAGDIFTWKGLVFQQSGKVFRIGTDALLLATWTPRVVPRAASLADAGTGTGFLAIAIGHAFPDASVAALDVQADSLALARHNVRLNGLTRRYSVIPADLLAWPASGRLNVDLVVTNPPYFGHHVPSASIHEAVARHRNFTPAAWLSGCVALLQAAGHLCIVIPAADASAWIRAANDLGWYVSDRLDVRVNTTDQEPFRALLHFSGQLVRPNTESLVLCGPQGEWHPDFIRWRGYP